MASKSTSTSPQNEGFVNIEDETEHTSTEKKRRRKGFLWNPNISISSRRVWRRKRRKTSAEAASSLDKLAENDDEKFVHEGELTAPTIEQDIYEEAGCEETETSGSDDSDSDSTSSTDYEGYVSSDDSLPISDDDQADLLQFEAESRYSFNLITLDYFVGKNCLGDGTNRKKSEVEILISAHARPKMSKRVSKAAHKMRF